MNKEKEIKRGEIVIYKTAKNEVDLKVRLEFETGELKKNSVSSILEHTASDGKTYKTQFYNLDAIISVGYRVNSARATQFRIWATKTLKQYLVKGYVINEKRLLKAREKFKELQSAIGFLEEKSKKELLAGHSISLSRITHFPTATNVRVLFFLSIFWTNRIIFIAEAEKRKSAITP